MKLQNEKVKNIFGKLAPMCNEEGEGRIHSGFFLLMQRA